MMLEQDDSTGDHQPVPASGEKDARFESASPAEVEHFDEIDLLFYEHAITVRHLIEGGFAKSGSKASRLITSRYEKHLIDIVGKAHNIRTGKGYEYYYSSRHHKDFHHSVGVTNSLWGYIRHAKIKQASADKNLRPNWEMVMGDVKSYGEYDSGNMRHKTIQERLRRYREIVNANVLIVTSKGPQRMEGLLHDARKIGLENVSVTTLDLIVREPFGSIWRWPVDTELHKFEESKL